MDVFAMSLILLTISTTGGAINLIVSILRLRAPGMSISKMPVYLYSTLTMSFLVVIAMPALYRSVRLSGARPPLLHSLLHHRPRRQSHTLAAVVLVFRAIPGCTSYSCRRPG